MTSEDNLLNSIEEIRKEIIRFNQSSEYQKLAGFFEHKTFYEILNISRKENIHSSFIGWLFNPEESHGLGEYPLKKFLECILGVLNDGKQKDFLNKLPKDFVNSIITETYDLDNIELKMEKWIDSQSRFDIYLEAEIKYNDSTKPKQKIRIVIENKVKAKEHNQQTVRYSEWINAHNDSINIPVFLSPIPNIKLLELSEPECVDKKFVQINYQFLLDYLFQPCLKKDISEQTRFLIQEYIRNLSVPSLINNDDNNGELIMAIGKEESELLKMFWKKHEKLLSSVLYSISIDPEQDPDTQAQVSEALDSLNKNKSMYLFENKQLNKGRLVNSVLRSFVSNNHQITFEELKLKFPDNVQGSYGVFTTKENAENISQAKGHKRHHTNPEDLIKLQDETVIATCNQWEPENIKRFINCATANNLKIEVK